MTILLRRITAAKWWKNTFERRTPGEGDPIPLWCSGEFLPAPEDDGALSVFELNGDDQLERLNAAFALQEKIQGELMWVTARREAVESAGLELTSEPASTFDSDVNTWHRDILLTRLSQVESLTQIFVDGEVHRFSQQQLLNAVKKSVAANNIDLVRAFKRSEGSGREYLVKLIETHAVKLVVTT